MQIEKIILGHNSFFGINHSDYEKEKNCDKFKNISVKLLNSLLC